MSLGSKIKIILGRFSGATILFLLDKALEMRGVYTDNPNLSNILVALSFGWLVFALLTWPQKRLAIGNNNRHPIILDQDFRPIRRSRPKELTLFTVLIVIISTFASFSLWFWLRDRTSFAAVETDLSIIGTVKGNEIVMTFIAGAKPIDDVIARIQVGGRGHRIEYGAWAKREQLTERRDDFLQRISFKPGEIYDLYLARTIGFGAAAPLQFYSTGPISEAPWGAIGKEPIPVEITLIGKEYTQLFQFVIQQTKGDEYLPCLGFGDKAICEHNGMSDRAALLKARELFGPAAFIRASLSGH